MFSPLYYIVFGILALSLQKTKEQKWLVGVYFSLLLSSPFIRQIFSLPYELFYIVVGVLWGVAVILLEESKVRCITLISAAILSAHFLYSPDIMKVLLVEASLYAFFWKSKLSDLIYKVDAKLNKWRNNVLH